MIAVGNVLATVATFFMLSSNLIGDWTELM